MHNSITDVPGIKVGHAHNDEALTGCTVILCEGGAIGGVDQRGGAPGTRETDLLRPMHLVEKVHAILLSGGSAFGLDAASGVMRYLEECGVGYDVGVARVPIVPAAVIFDLAIGRSDVRPGAAMGYQACVNAIDGVIAEGNVGVGAGATVGKILGMSQAMKSGVGTASLEIGGRVIVGAIAAVNAFGDVIDPTTNQIIAGARTDDGCADTLNVMRGWSNTRSAMPTNTVIGVVATNAALSKEHINKVAQLAHDGLARAIRPAHTMFDGDTIFALSMGDESVDVNVIGAFAAEVFAQAIVRGVRAAKSAGGLPGLGA
ncbi:MAG TPA: P1 family peptidase [Anaerolineae bacterium]|nr:P1 family peptidase [Anaerolineae bacterium]